ncbi:MAG TPA: hypothetical protein VMB71_10955 [Acetobacteraceae bacterium]|nr:hypothetical protein [Acetobacteraceae bacterium]
MGAWGGIIMGFFGAVFAALTLGLQLGRTRIVLGLPFIGFAAIALAATMVIRRPGEGHVSSEPAGRVMMWSSVAEGIGLFIAANLVTNLGHPELLLPAMALVVGLHFLPMAYGIPFFPFYVLGLALLVAAAIGFVATQPLGGDIAGFGAAGALWVAAVLAVRRDMLAKKA